jgi:hypothetical protein
MSRMPQRVGPRYASLRSLARYLGVKSQTALAWCRRAGIEVGRVPYSAHYADDRPRKGGANMPWRIDEEGVRQLLRHVRANRPDVAPPEWLWQ